MLGWVIGKPWRGFVAFIGCMVMAGVVFPQDMPPTPELSAAAATPPSNSAAVPPATPPAPPTAPLLTEAQLQQLVAPIALYPDPLLAQILMASTYPLEVVEAARWVSVPANRALKGDALANALQAQNWDPPRQSAGAVPTGPAEHERPVAMDAGSRQRLSRPADRRPDRGGGQSQWLPNIDGLLHRSPATRLRAEYAEHSVPQRPVDHGRQHE